MTEIKEEFWKNIPGYENKYQVSNIGRVARISQMRQEILKPSKDYRGHLYITLFSGKKGKRHSVAYLVLNTFYGNSLESTQIIHKNGIIHDNNINNLKWHTSEIAERVYRIGYEEGIKASNNFELKKEENIAPRQNKEKLILEIKTIKNNLMIAIDRKMWDYVDAQVKRLIELENNI